MTKKSGISSSLEDYLEAIAEITEINGHAHTKDIADKLHVKMPSVTNALQGLATRDLIIYRSHAPVELTPAGARVAAEIRRRHQILKGFFQNILNVEPDEADSSACRIEHVIGDTALNRLVMLTEAITTREDCAGLREYLQTALPEAAADPQKDLFPLSELPVDKSAVIVRIAENLRGLKKFADLGLVPGTLVEVEGEAPFGNLLRIRVLNSSLSLRKDDAMYIWVKATE
jgi:DtxR family Mn-dependent transcriptional regulator